MSNIELKNVADVSCSVCTPNGGDIIEQILGRLVFKHLAERMLQNPKRTISSVDIMYFNNKMSDDNKLRENDGEKSKLIFFTKSFQAVLIPEIQEAKGTDIIRGSFS